MRLRPSSKGPCRQSSRKDSCILERAGPSVLSGQAPGSPKDVGPRRARAPRLRDVTGRAHPRMLDHVGHGPPGKTVLMHTCLFRWGARAAYVHMCEGQVSPRSSRVRAARVPRMFTCVKGRFHPGVLASEQRGGRACSQNRTRTRMRVHGGVRKRESFEKPRTETLQAGEGAGDTAPMSRQMLRPWPFWRGRASCAGRCPAK